MATERQVGSQAAGTRLSVFRHRPQQSPRESCMADCPLMQHGTRKWSAEDNETIGAGEWNEIRGDNSNPCAVYDSEGVNGWKNKRGIQDSRESTQA